MEINHAPFQPPMESLVTHVLEPTNISLLRTSAINQVSLRLRRSDFVMLLKEYIPIVGLF